MKRFVEFIDNLICKLLDVLSKYLGSDSKTDNDRLIYGARVTPVKTEVPQEDLESFRHVIEEVKYDEDFECNIMVDDLGDFIAERTEQNPQFTEMVKKCGGNCDCDGNCGDNCKCKTEEKCVCGDADCEAKNVKVVVKKVKMRKVYHVVPDKNGWAVKEEKNKNPSARADRKVDAVAKAKELAKKAKLGQVIVHKKDGKIQTEYTYGKDPRETKG